MGFLTAAMRSWLPALAAVLCVTACLKRDYENPFLAGGSDLEDSWRQDRDGNGIADSVEFYARDCRGTPAECLRIARSAADAKAQASLPKGPIDSATPPADTVPAVKDPVPAATPKDTLVKLPPKDTTVNIPPQDSTLKVPPKDTTIKVPPKDTTIKVPPRDTTIKVPPRDTTVKVPPKDTLVKVPPIDTTVKTPPKDTGIVTPPRDTLVVVPPDIPVILPPVIAVTGIQATEVFLPMGVSKVTPAVSVLPRDAKEQGYALLSLDESIVRVSGIDLVPVKPGTAKVRARSTDGGFTTEFRATVLVPDTNVYEETVSVAPLEMTVGDPARAPAVVWKPANTTNQGYTLVSGNPAVVKVVTEGGADRCLAVSPGVATVTLRTRAKGLVATFLATVRAAPPRVASVSSPDLAMVVGTRTVPVIAFDPPDAGNQGYVLSSNKPEIVRVEGREIVAVKKGGAEITVTSLDGGRTHVFKVKVEPAGGGKEEGGG